MTVRINYEDVDSYTELFNAMKPDYEVISGVIEVIQPSTIAELGCGSGRLMPIYLESSATEILGFDIEEGMYNAFKNISNTNKKVRGEFNDITTGLPRLPDNTLIIATSSLFKHVHPSKRVETWINISNSLLSNQIIFVDHCSYVYGIHHNTEWNSYFDYLKKWWDKTDWDMLKNFEWKKESTSDLDILCYRKNGGIETRITTYPYPINNYLSDINNTDLNYISISNKYNKKRTIEGMERSIGFITKLHPDKLYDSVCQINNIINE